MLRPVRKEKGRRVKLAFAVEEVGKEVGKKDEREERSGEERVCMCVIAGSGIFLFIIIVFICCFFKREKKRERERGGERQR